MTVGGRRVLPFHYKVVQLRKSWKDAQQYCASHYNADLAIVTNQTDDDALRSYVKGIPGQLYSSLAHNIL